MKAFLKTYVESFGMYHKESEGRDLLVERGWILRGERYLFIIINF